MTEQDPQPLPEHGDSLEPEKLTPDSPEEPGTMGAPVGPEPSPKRPEPHGPEGTPPPPPPHGPEGTPPPPPTEGQWSFDDPWAAFDAIRNAFGPGGRRGPRGPHGHPHGPHGHGPGGPRAGRGDVRSAILLLLSEGEMHGYQIIREIDERSHGTWKPSPGSVYPTLQMLADEGLVEVSETRGRKTYHLTDEGTREADKAHQRPAPWQTPGAQDAGKATALPRAAASLAQAVAQVATTGTSAQNEEVIKLLEETRRKVYGILSQE